MSAFVTIEPEVEDGLTIIVDRYPKEGLGEVLTVMAKCLDDLRLRFGGQPVCGWDDSSIQALDEFLGSKHGVLIVDNSRIYFVAEHGRLGESTFLITRTGLFDVNWGTRPPPTELVAHVVRKDL